jgi:3-hydroxy-9,10-secoandrosta-1,3,5(10)-triene-9,17-dione monooxygenase reductase component
VPILDRTLAWLCCDMTAIYPGGDHVIVVGSVVDLGGSGGEPLLFYGGDYRMLDRKSPVAGVTARAGP